MAFLREPKYKLLASEVDQSADTYNYYFRPEAFEYHGLQYIITGGSDTLKTYGTIDPDGSTEGNPVWKDITNDTFGSASFTASTILSDNTSKLTCYSRIKVEVVAADTKQINSFVAVADVAASLDGTYFILYDEVGSVAFWIDVDDSGTTIPSGASAADRAVEITTITTGMTAAQVGTAVYTAIVADSKFEAGADNLDGTFTVASTTTGDKTPGADGDTGFTITETLAGIPNFKILLKQA